MPKLYHFPLKFLYLNPSLLFFLTAIKMVWEVSWLFCINNSPVEQTMTHAYLSLWFLPRRDSEMANSWCSCNLMMNDFPRATSVTWALAVCKAIELAGSYALCILFAMSVTGVLQSCQLESFQNYIFNCASSWCLYLPKKTGMSINQQLFQGW